MISIVFSINIIVTHILQARVDSVHARQAPVVNCYNYSNNNNNDNNNNDCRVFIVGAAVNCHRCLFVVLGWCLVV